MIEGVPNNENLSPAEEALYKRFSSKFSGMSRADFIELRNDALRAHSAEPKDFKENFDGTLMEDNSNKG